MEEKISYTERIREYCRTHKNSILDVSYVSNNIFVDIPYKTLLKVLNRLAQDGIIQPISKGVYYIGKKYLTEDEILSKYIEKGKGMVIGYKLYNRIGLSPYQDMTYSQIVEKLLSKYGKVPYDYFVSEDCKTKNRKNSRTSEGLFCHHIDEDKAILLANDKYAIKNPFDYQKADRLVYCNFLEHFLLHIKIVEEPRNANANKNELPGIGGAVNFLVKQINDFYNGTIYTQEYLAIATKVIENDYDSYIVMLQHLWNIIKSKPEYSFIQKEDLARGWDVNVIKKILNELN